MSWWKWFLHCAFTGHSLVKTRESLSLFKAECSNCGAAFCCNPSDRIGDGKLPWDEEWEELFNSNDRIMASRATPDPTGAKEAREE